MPDGESKAGSERIPLESSDFYLHVAQRALADLKALPPEGVSLGAWKPAENTIRLEMPSDHFRHAVVCTVFSAAAVEHALVAVALLRKTLQSRGPERSLIGSVWPGMLTGKALLKIMRAATKIEEPLLSRIEGLLARRNKIVHSQAEDSETPVEELPGETERKVELPPITRDVIGAAPGDVKIAEDALAALRVARGDPDWNPFR